MLFSLSSQFFNQIVKGRKILSCKLSFLSLFVALSDCVCNKLLFLFSSSIISDKLINCHSLDCSKNLLQSWNKTFVFDVQNKLCHDSSFCLWWQSYGNKLK